MSTDSEDANFDETLKNLQLLNAAAVTTSDQSSSSRVPVNPFQLPPCSSNHLHHQNDAIVKQIFGTRCECGAERGAGTVAGQKALPQPGKHHHTSLEHGIINPTPFKHKAKGEKKVIVREAILKNIGKCVHQNLAKQSNVAKEQQQRLSNTFLPAPSPLKPSRSENNLAAKGFHQEAGDDILDFRLLVAQCSELTLSNGSKPTPADGPNFSRTSFKTLRQPELFASNSNSMAFIGPSRRNRRARQLKRYNSTSSLESDSSSSGNGSVHPAGLGRTPPHHAGSHQQQQQQSQQQSPSNSSSPTASSASSSASCSTQARLNGSSMPCDITIDEMASYFETLVHIPKKMSSMAEMMYI